MKNHGGDPCICGDKETWHPECYVLNAKLINALRDCYLLALRMSRKEQKKDDSPSSEWNHIIRFCKSADKDGRICSTSILRAHAAMKVDQRETYSLTPARAAIKKATD